LEILSIFEHWANPILIRLSGKTVIPFNTNDEYGIGTSYETIRELCTNLNVNEGFNIQGSRIKDGKACLLENESSAETEVQKWFRNNEPLKKPHKTFTK
jgi:hypothetical protein